MSNPSDYENTARHPHTNTPPPELEQLAAARTIWCVRVLLPTRTRPWGC